MTSPSKFPLATHIAAIITKKATVALSRSESKRASLEGNRSLHIDSHYEYLWAFIESSTTHGLLMEPGGVRRYQGIE